MNTMPPPARWGVLDRLAFWLEGGGNGIPAERLIELGDVLSAPELGRLAPAVREFFAAPLRYSIAGRLEANALGALVLPAFARLARQSHFCKAAPNRDLHPIRQILYQDAEGRTHWDRYVFHAGSWRRLFLARISASPDRWLETFVIHGLPVCLSFSTKVENGALVCTLVPAESSPLARGARVEYRTAPVDGGLRTQGDFFIPLLKLRVRTEFRMRVETPAQEIARSSGHSLVAQARQDGA